MKTTHAWLLEIDGPQENDRIHFTTHHEELKVADTGYRPLPFMLEVGNGRRASKKLPENLTLTVRADDEKSGKVFQELGNPLGRSLILRNIEVENTQESDGVTAEYQVTAVTPKAHGVCCQLERKPGPPGNPTRSYRIVRKMRRSFNELRSIYEERFKREKIKSWPVTLNLNHTTACNLRCVMCEQAFGIDQKIMDLSTYRRIRDELFDRISELDLTVMGDPFCVPKAFFGEILDDVDRYDLRMLMTTNATLFPPDEQLDKIVRLASKITISFDGATKDTFERIRVGAKFDETVSNIERLNRARLRLPFYRRPYLSFNYVAMRSNLEEVPLFVELAKSWGGSAVNVCPVLRIHPSLDSEILDENDPALKKIFSEARRKADQLGIALNTANLIVEKNNDFVISRKLGKIKKQLSSVLSQGANYVFQSRLPKLDTAERRCPFLWNKVYVGFEGDINTCCHPNFISAGALQDRSFQEVWNGKLYSHLRKTLNTEKVAGPCKDCHLLRM